MEFMTCTRCNETKPINDFMKSSSTRSGRKNPCKQCKNLFIKAGVGKDTPISVVKNIVEQKQKERLERLERNSIEMVCTKCAKLKPLSDFRRLKRARNGRCQPCKLCASALKKIYKSKPRAQARARDLQKNRARRLRLEILQAYGCKCACCGEDEPKFLAVDHINNDGASHRKEIGGSGAIYYWLKRNNFPQNNFQLLCHNCNIAKSCYGECPHKTKQNEIHIQKTTRIYKKSEGSQETCAVLFG